MNSVVHFEMPYENAERMAKFYQTAFGWKMQPLGEEMGNYVMAGTTETGENGMPVNPGAINGGFFPKTDESMTKHPSVVVAVKDIKAAMTQVKEAGGTVHGEPMEIPGVGHIVSLTDTEGNFVSMLQPFPMG